MSISRYPIYMLLIFIISANGLNLTAQENIHRLEGTIKNAETMQPVPFALVIVKEAGIVSTVRQGGAYSLTVPKPGRYSVTVRAGGLQEVTTSVTISGTVRLDFTLSAPGLSTPSKRTMKAVTVRGAREIQSISRQTMTVKEIKEVPASFGDSISALTALPGINRSGGFFGPLIIRGADSASNGYQIDGIPMFKVMHFGGIHSVIANDLMSSIDLYSSAFPAQFTDAQAAVININTVDDVDRAGGIADVGLISANALVKFPIIEQKNYNGRQVDEKKGYVIASGRVGYFSLLIPAFYKYVLDKDLDYLPNYWDYQFKARYSFNSEHSLTFLAFGSKDTIDLILKESWLEEGSDPALTDFNIYSNDQAHSAGLTYKYEYSNRLSNSLLSFISYNKSRQWYDLPNATSSELSDLGIDSIPTIMGLKDSLTAEWIKDHSTLRAGAEARYYIFKTDGKSIGGTKDTVDLNDPDAFEIIELGDTYKNVSFTGYVENRFKFGGLLFVPGVAAQYLSRGSSYFIDPRGLISYTFDTGTTIGAAGGWYSMFHQTMPEYFYQLPYIAGSEFGPARSIHRSVSLEQKAGPYTFKVEGFYNNFWNQGNFDSYIDENGELASMLINKGKLKTRGFEITAKVNDETDQGLFGWVSYTYNNAEYITNQSELYTEYGKEWLTSPYDMTHVLKLVAGYTAGKNTFSAKFQFNTAAPYTAITSSYSDDAFTAVTGKTRIVPVYGKPYTERLDPEYRLDVRYTRKTSHRWGYVSWYAEVIGIVSSQTQYVDWDYRYNYEEGVNPKVKTENGLTFLPNFGIEIKF